MEDKNIYELISESVKRLEKEINENNKFSNSSACYCEAIPMVLGDYRIKLKHDSYNIKGKDIISEVKTQGIEELDNIIKDLLNKEIRGY